MEFLCPYHRRQLAILPATQQQDLWLLWMEHALYHFERRELRDALLLSGCAFELATVSGMPIELTLAAIFAARVLRQSGSDTHAESAIHRAIDKLYADEAQIATIHVTDSLERCQQVLRDTRLQPDFFLNYLNWPVFWEGVPVHQQAAQA